MENQILSSSLQFAGYTFKPTIETYKTTKGQICGIFQNEIVKPNIPYEDCLTKYENNGTPADIFLINLTGGKYIILDSDDKNAELFLRGFDEKFKLANYNNKTRSTSNYLYLSKLDEQGKQNKYKFHRWFTSEEPKLLVKNLGLNGSHLDYLTKDLLIEANDDEIEFDIFNLPVMTKEMHNYLLTIPGKEKKEPKTKQEPKQETKQEPKIFIDDKNSILISKILDGLAKERYENFDSWLKCGMIIFNEDLPFKLWDEWAKQSNDKYSKEANLNNWARFKKGSLTQATLWQWLKEDNIKLFSELMADREDLYNIFKNQTQAEVAQLFKNMNPTAYIYTGESVWYSLGKNNIWKKSGGTPPQLTSDIYITMTKLRIDHDQALNKKLLMVNSDNLDMTASIEKKKEILQAFGKKIGSSNFVSGVIDFLKSLYMDVKEDLIDSNIDIFACNNKLFDCKKLLWRNIKPEDYVLTHTGYGYPEKRNSEIEEDIKKILFTIFESVEMVDYYFMILSHCLSGDRSTLDKQKFYIHTGNGSNGKSMMDSFVSKVLGDYYHLISEETLTKSMKEASRALPDIVKMKGKRLTVTSEPSNGTNDKFQAPLIKKITGGERISARDLRESTKTFYNQSALWVMANNIPKIDLCGGIERRIIVCPYPFKFVDFPKPNTEQRQSDSFLSNKLNTNEDYRSSFLHLMVETFIIHEKAKNKCLKKGVHYTPPTLPKSIKEASGEYMNDNNAVKVWLDTKYILTNHKDKKNYIQSNILYRDFLAFQDNQICINQFSKLMKHNGCISKKDNNILKYINIIVNPEYKKDKLDEDDEE